MLVDRIGVLFGTPSPPDIFGRLNDPAAPLVTACVHEFWLINSLSWLLEIYFKYSAYQTTAYPQSQFEVAVSSTFTFEFPLFEEMTTR